MRPSDPSQRTTVPATQTSQGDRLAAEAAVSLDWNVGDVILDLYEVMPVNDKGDAFHVGGFGKVYRVRHKTWNMELAVKSPRGHMFETERHRANFIRECETWINLGMHPNVASCYYVRELGGVPRIFAEYVDGGSLKDWIDSGLLYDGDDRKAILARMLDIAIQFAQGLHFAHEQGLVHQDVKPHNVMMTQEGEAKVVDFGLARARAASGTLSQNADPGRTISAPHGGGYTPAYCSPEQYEGKPLTRQADMWSWGLSILEMFAGGATWQPGDPSTFPGGMQAAEALAAFIKHNGETPDIPPMPAGVADLLRHCFNGEAERPATMKEVAERLASTYEEELDEEYVRPEPDSLELQADALNNHAVSLMDLGKTETAEELLRQALACHKGHLASTYNLALLEWRSGRITDHDAILRLKEAEPPEDAPWRRSILIARMLLESDDCEGTLSAMESIQEKDPDATTLMHTAKMRLPTSRRCVRVLEGHKSPIHSVCICSDGRKGLSASWESFDSAWDGGEFPDTNVRIWDLTQGYCIHQFRGRQTRFPAVCMSAHGGWAAAVGDDGLLKLWNISTGRLHRKIGDHADKMKHIRMSSDGRWILSCSETSDEMKLWNADSGGCVRTLDGHATFGFVNALYVSVDGHWALSGHASPLHEDNVVCLWDLTNGQSIRTFEGHTWFVQSVCMSFDHRWAISGSADTTLRVWSIEDGSCIQTLRGHTGTVDSVLISDDGQWILSGGRDGTLRLWETQTGRCVRTFACSMGWEMAASLSSDGRVALSGSGDGELRVWNVLGNGSHPASMELVRPSSGTQALSKLRRYKTLISAGERANQACDFGSAADSFRQARAVPGYSRCVDAMTRWAGLYRVLPRVGLQDSWEEAEFVGHEAEVNAVCLSFDGYWALSGGADRTLRLWSISTGACERTLQGHSGAILSISISVDGRWALSGSDDKTLRLWDIESGHCVRTFSAHIKPVLATYLSRDGRWAVSVGGDMIVWRVADGKILRRISNPFSLCVSSTERWCVSGGFGGIQAWDIPSGGRLWAYRQLERELAGIVCLSTDGHWVASSGELTPRHNPIVRVWDVARRSCVRAYEEEAWVSSLCMSVDRRWLLGGSENGSVLVWDVLKPGFRKLVGDHQAAVTSVCLSSDGKWAVSGGKDSRLRLWRLDWKLENRAAVDWDDGATSCLEVFLTQHTPYAASFPTHENPTEDEIRLALTRRGRPRWTEADFKHLLYTFGCAGFGWLRPEGVRRKLEEMAADWKGPPPLPGDE